MVMSTMRVKFVKKMEGKRKNYFLLSYFLNISLWVHPNFEFRDPLDAGLNSASNPYPHYILLRYVRNTQIKFSIKKRILILKYIFYWNFHFWVPWVRQKYALWIWVGCGTPNSKFGWTDKKICLKYNKKN